MKDNNAKPNTTKKPTTKKVVGSVVKKKPIKKPGQKQIRSTRKMTVELFESICKQLSFSELGLVKLCKEHNSSAPAFHDLMFGNEKLTEIYMRAREYQAEFLFDLQREIVMRRDEDHTPFTGANVVSRDRLIADTIKWQASKLNKKKYGDKLEVDQKTELSGTVQVINLGSGIKPNETTD
jgi:hypothetical protein